MLSYVGILAFNFEVVIDDPGLSTSRWLCCLSNAGGCVRKKMLVS